MNFNFVLIYSIALIFYVGLFRFIMWGFDKAAQKKYARNHFKLTERYRNGL